ncbi:MAG: hypothetical protein ACT452_05920 [Microthrixaceae bacterium]
MNQELLEFGIEANGLHRRWLNAEPRSTALAASGDELVDVVPALGLSGQCLDEVVGDRGI